MKKLVAILLMVLSTTALADCKTNANGSVSCSNGQMSSATQCINSHDGTRENRLNKHVGPNIILFGDICQNARPNDTGNQEVVTQDIPEPKKPKWNVCLNGVSIVDGTKCDMWNTQPQLVTGHQAMDIIRHGKILSSTMTYNEALFIVNRYQHTYSCRVNNNGTNPRCNEWRN